jgi:hypothetical protein
LKINYFKEEVPVGGMEGLDFDLDAKGFDVLEALYENGGGATTTEVKEYTGIEKNAIIHYRFEKLEEEGIVEVGVGEPQGNRTPPKKAILTENGEKLCRSGFFEEETPTIVERMDRMERRFSAVVEDFHEVADEFEQWRMKDGEEVEVGELIEKFERFEEMTAGVSDDALERAMDVEGRVSELEEGVQTKSKYVNDLRSIDRNPGREGVTEVTAVDFISAIRALENEVEEIAYAIEEEGMSNSDGEKFIATTGGYWD